MIQEVSKGDYTLKVSYLGYVTYKQSVKVDQNIDLGILLLNDSITSLKQVIITPKMIETFADKKIYRLTPDQKKVYSSSLGALEVIPKLQVSDNQVSMLNSKAVKILINGIASDASDLSVIPSSDILRIEFFETPPARFANLGLGGVVNVIVKRDKGGSVAMNLQKGITSKWTIGTGDFKYNWGNSQIGIKYNMNYHDDNKRLLDETLYYSVNGITYDKNKIGKNSPYIFNYQLAEINFTNQKVDNYIFNAKLSLNNFDRRRSSNQTVFSKTGSDDTLMEEGMSTDKDSYLKPIADLYFSKQINKNKEFILNVVGTYYKTKYDYNYSEIYNDAENFYTSTWITGNKYSLIGDALYGYTFGKNKLTIGARYTNASATQETMRNQSQSQTSGNNELYEYAELSSSLGKKFTYAISAGLNYNSFNCDIADKKYSYFYFRPSLTATYNFNDRNDLQFSYQVNTITPTLSELSNTPYFKDEKYVFSGNNNLNPFNQHELSLSYDYENKRVTYSVELSLQYAKKPIAPVFIQDSDYILQTEANIDNLKTYSASMFFQWYLFENNLVRLRWYSELFRTDNKYKNESWGHTDYRVIPSILVDYKKWDLEIFYQSSTKV
ncbi:MAG: outer membrane beta-barrel protein, partial [Bacteroidota bacterium]|nr:outer membrane beta-barrel protein [Bacteroidota bacterium]